MTHMLTAATSLAQKYRGASPFPHVVIDDFLDPALASRALAEFPRHDSAAWIQYRHVSSRKAGKTDRVTFPDTIGQIIDTLNGPDTLRWLSELTGISGLIADASLEGGGMHQTMPGGYLDVHADFSAHARHANWRRRVNLIVYLNAEWRDEYGGHLELWDRGMQACTERIAPVFNRCVVFNTDEHSYHGHPDPLRCPEGSTRKSLALYYYTEERAAVTPRTTRYQARPSDSPGKKVMVRLNGAALQMYSDLKHALRRNPR